MWFLLGLLVGLSVEVEPATKVVETTSAAPMPLWAMVLIGVGAVGMAVPTAIMIVRSLGGGFRAAREAERRAVEQARRELDRLGIA